MPCARVVDRQSLGTRLLEQVHCISKERQVNLRYSVCVKRNIHSSHSLEILNGLSFKIVSSERIRLPTFSNNY